ncbi:PUA-like domain-containing protein [Mycena pura]|uniref:PUA-like domain-containing protein n=1 Tax=Mycena pura TaxID=153505 RepID=A0AAD7E2Q2_9AGAR|nr:PUA-like domain-containing protein [Mycena pura]
MVSEYEKQRLRNMERNKALLMELGLNKPLFEPKEVKRVKASKKRKPEPVEDRDSEPVPKTPRIESVNTTSGALRRSGRNAGKTIDYQSEQHIGSPVPVSINMRRIENTGPMGRGTGSKRLHDPKVFGSIPSIEVGTWWESREACSADAIHAPWVAGISGGDKGAYSVALSGGYPDDIDEGYALYVHILALHTQDRVCISRPHRLSAYAVSGGRNLKGTKANPLNVRMASYPIPSALNRSSFGQPLKFNKSLKISSDTKKPIRVIRGYKLDSPYAPYEGYRYDGLYRVEKAWQEKGMDGFLVCKFAFKRLPGQQPLPRRAEDDSNDDSEIVEAKAAVEDPKDSEEEAEGSDGQN